MDKLPQELIDQVIGSIDRASPYGYSSLLACSRVSRSWRRQAQKQLFPHVQFISTDQLRRWDRNVSLESEIPSYVRHLRWIFRSATWERPDPFLENTFPGRFASFLKIESLYVSDLSLRFFDTTAIEQNFSRLSHSLQCLEINHLTASPERLCFLVSLLPNLRRINISYVTMLKGEGGPGLNHPH
ncbi:hypothetical protein BDM02DRAFT_1996712 [Thelephora ganbajun]|uniref:Uncharacterized protein n=1 Tax=Thelephora ganbajun TaxID=370292 RepID=A0ACB6ZGU7_THEGA|nr:hypothetical protein BDM02DRAFT_1996712 [Thelephora ganbajun]